jgi:type IV pilus assembly protein PilV
MRRGSFKVRSEAMNTRNRIMDQRGFSLLELLIAVTLLAVGMLAVASMQGTAIGANTIANRYTTLATLAQQTMEDIGSWSREDIRLRTNLPNVDYDLDPATDGTLLVIPGMGTFRATYSITPNSINPGVTRIDVTVTDGSRTFEVNTYKVVRVPA